MDGPYAREALCQHKYSTEGQQIWRFSESKRVTTQLKGFPVTMHAGSDLNMAVI